jgi:hypothetical protein
MLVARYALWLLASASVVSGAGCAGKSSSTGGDDDAGNAGESASGGRASGGRENGGSSSGTPSAGSGNAGSGGATASRCASKPKPDCTTSTFFVYVAESNECKRAALTACEEQVLPSFIDLTDCLAACPGALPEDTACDTASDCMLASAGCCAACEPSTESDYVSINRRRRDALGECGPIGCVPCNEVPEGERSGQYLIPTCNSHSCGIGDVRNTPSTSCSEDADCMLRDGADCCEGCDGAGLVAVSSYAWIEEGCRQQDGCDACVPNIPPSFRAGCNDEGHCFVRQIPF